MTSRVPSSCFCVVSGSRLLSTRGLLVRGPAASIPYAIRSKRVTRQYAQDAKPLRSIQSQDYSPRAALTTIESKSQTDLLNPPRSVFPPLLQLPVRSSSDNLFAYLFRLGKAYGTFYKDGIKAVWFNYKAAKVIRQRLSAEHGVKDTNEAAVKELMTRAEWQLLARNNHDIGKLPLFGILVLIFGEWLPLLVPFMPAVVPGTCRIPKQVLGMRGSAEKRRQRAFRQGVAEPSIAPIATKEISGSTWPALDPVRLETLLGKLQANQLLHLSTTLNLHNRFWDVMQIAPPSVLLKRALTRRLRYLSIDDRLLLKGGGESAPGKLLAEELALACEERGIDVLGKRETALRDELSLWLRQQSRDNGQGHALFVMLFRRPNAWTTRTDRS